MGWARGVWLRAFPRAVRMCDVPVGGVFRFAPQRGAAELLVLSNEMKAEELIFMEVRVRWLDGTGRELGLNVDALQMVWRVG